MNKLTKVLLYAVGGVVLFLLICVAGVNLYVESEGVQARLEAALTKELRMPVKLTRIRFSLWSGLRVSGLTVPLEQLQDDDAEGKKRQEPPEYFLEAPHIGAKISLSALFSRRLVIRELLIDSPTIVWRQSEKGRWELPRLPKEEAAPKEERPREKPSKDQAKQVTARGEKKKLEFRVVAARLEEATFRFLDRKGEPLAVFEGVTLNCPVVERHEAQGTAMIQRVTLHDRVVIRNLIAPFEFVDGQLALTKFDAQLAEGNVTGSFYLYPEMRRAPFSLDVRAERVELNRLFEEIGADDGMLRSHGFVNGYLTLRGLTGESKSITGAGQLLLVDGRMEQYPLLQSIGTALKIDELTRLELKEARAEFWIGDEKVHVDDLQLESTNLRIYAKGFGRFNGRLRLDAGLVVNKKISRQLPSWVDSNFDVLDKEEGLREIRFRVTGTLEEPETDLMRVMVGQKLEEQAVRLFRTFRSITGGKKKDSDDRKRDKKSDDEDETAREEP